MFIDGHEVKMKLTVTVKTISLKPPRDDEAAIYVVPVEFLNSQ